MSSNSLGGDVWWEIFMVFAMLAMRVCRYGCIGRRGFLCGRGVDNMLWRLSMNMYVFVVSNLVSSTASNNVYSFAWRILGYPCTFAHDVKL